MRPGCLARPAPYAWCRHPQGPLSIDKGATLVVERPFGASVTCVRGGLWITHDGDAKDIVIETGTRYVSDRRGRMLVYGLLPSTALVA